MLRYLQDKGFFHLLSVKLLTQFLGFGSSLIVAKFLTSVELGEIKILQSYTALFIVPAGFGLSAAVLKVCSEKRDESEKEGILRLSLARSFFPIAFSLLVLCVLSLSGIITSSERLAFWLLVYAVTIPFAVFTDILITFLQAAKKIREMARVQGIIKIQSFILIVLSTWLWGFRGFIFATIAAYIIGTIPLFYQVGPGFLRKTVVAIPPGFTRAAIFSMLSNGIGVLGQYTDIFILDYCSSERAQIGYYSLATIFLLAVMQVTGTVQAIVTPYFSENAVDQKWFRSKLVLNEKRLAAFSIFVSLLMFAAAWVFVPLIYGDEYRPALIYLAVLLLKYVVWSSCAVIGVALFGLGMFHYNFIAAAISTAVGLPLSYLLLKQYGVVGVAWAQVFASAVLFVMVFIFIRVALRRAYTDSTSESST